jgi:hypothetical protein
LPKAGRDAVQAELATANTTDTGLGQAILDELNRRREADLAASRKAQASTVVDRLMQNADVQALKSDDLAILSAQQQADAIKQPPK